MQDIFAIIYNTRGFLIIYLYSFFLFFLKEENRYQSNVIFLKRRSYTKALKPEAESPISEFKTASRNNPSHLLFE